MIPRVWALWALTAASLTASLKADVLVRSDGAPIEGKLVSQNSGEVSFQPEGATDPQVFARPAISRLLKLDEQGAILSDSTATTQPAVRWAVPAEPAAPPIIVAPAGASYYVIPLRGEVGATVLAGALEKSLADAAARRPTVVILDIDSPGGQVAEAKEIMAVIHEYNKRLRIVALADQDLSAAAILSLSCRQIFVKATGTIGAAVAYNPSRLTLPAKLEEKMQSAWRAVARNSAEEGGHETLLAEAMIDNTLELHLETANGKPVVKQGAGDRMLCRAGKVLTLSSHEAVECGLAAGQADDYAEMGKALGLPGWAECPGLGIPLANYLPTRSVAFKSELETIESAFALDVQDAIQADPSRTLVTVVRAPASRARPAQRGFPPSPASGMTRSHISIVSSGSPSQWKRDSLLCVLALDAAESELRKALSLCEAFGQKGEAAGVTESLSRLAGIRQQTFAGRNKYGASNVQVAAIPAQPPPSAPATPAAAPQTPPAGTENAAPGVPAPAANSGPFEVSGTPPVNPAATEKTPAAGGTGGGHEFQWICANNAPVTGIGVMYGNEGGRRVIRLMRPTSDRPREAPRDTFIARDGFAVAGLLVNTDHAHVVAFRIIYARIEGGLIDMSSTYQSDWIGTPMDQTTTKLGGNGQTVVGIYGLESYNCISVGLVLIPTEAAMEAHRAARATASESSDAPTVGPFAVPDTAKQAEALKLVQEVHAPYPPADRVARDDMAARLLTEGRGTTEDAAQRYVLLREARDLATQSGDLQTAMSAIEALGSSFSLDPFAMRTTVLNQMAASLQGAPTATQIAGAISAADRAIAADRYDDASRAATLAELWRARPMIDPPSPRRRPGWAAPAAA